MADKKNNEVRPTRSLTEDLKARVDLNNPFAAQTPKQAAEESVGNTIAGAEERAKMARESGMTPEDVLRGIDAKRATQTHHVINVQKLVNKLESQEPAKGSTEQ